MEIPFRELQHCNTATDFCQPYCQEKQNRRKKNKNILRSIREPQWECRTFALSS